MFMAGEPMKPVVENLRPLDLRQDAALHDRDPDEAGEPPDKYAILADFQDFFYNVSYPDTTPAIEEVFTTFLIPQMFAEAARGTDPAEAVSNAESQINAVFEKWRGLGKI
jgi:hypothetical protein